MADDPGKDKAAAEKGAGAAPKQAPAPLRGLRDSWQIPALAVGIALLGLGVVLNYRPAPAPDVEGILGRAKAHLEKREHEAALRTLNDEGLPLVGAGQLESEQLAQFHLMRGDAILLGQAAAKISNAQNHENGLKEYESAEQMLKPAPMEAHRIALMAESLLELGRANDAIVRIRSLPESEADRKQRLLRRVIEARLAAEGQNTGQTLDLLMEFAADARLEEADRLWAVARQAELRLESGWGEKALEHLLVSFQRFGEARGRAGAELYLLLGRCYFELGRFADAGRQLERARDQLEEGDPMLGEILALKGRIAQIDGDMQESRDLLMAVVNEHPATRSWLRAVLALGEVEAALGNTAASLEAFGRVVEGARRKTASEEALRELAPEAIAESLLRQQRERFERGDLEGALSFAMLADSLFEAKDTPPAVLLAIAQTQRALGDMLLAPVRAREGEPADLSRVDPVTRVQGRTHFLEAAAAYRRHAEAMVLADDGAFGDSLWLAADSFDQAGETDRAIEVFGEFVTGRPGDPRKPAAEFRMALAHLARGDYSVAAQFFEQIVKASPGGVEGARAHVLLARCRLMDEDPANDAEAEGLLSTVIGGRMLEPESPEFRDALVAIGRLKLREGSHEDAIRRLSEAAERFPGDPELPRVRYDLAEAYRRSAVEIDESLRQALPEAERRLLAGERAERLRTASSLYEQVRSSLEAQEPRRMTALERIQLRNAMFFRADCAFDLEDYDLAINLYDAAAQRYSSDPSSLVAMIQIVNSYVAKGAFREARTANERARQRLAQMPENVFESSDLPLDRRRLEQWLESTARLTASAPPGE